ncbi:uncharacterized protein LOC118408306 [Branchiostoma floridae]|uniref:Uncharacterized protein LOC118408306 n=1 Tax=Branchiostoma floridae TaxID=7739 RepID=A0A9J7HUY4_BRAFL|nr:uncharacterized protein LOC118408306 [Branchiostoma floridae]
MAEFEKDPTLPTNVGSGTESKELIIRGDQSNQGEIDKLKKENFNLKEENKLLLDGCHRQNVTDEKRLSKAVAKAIEVEVLREETTKIYSESNTMPEMEGDSPLIWLSFPRKKKSSMQNVSDETKPSKTVTKTTEDGVSWEETTEMYSQSNTKSRKRGHSPSGALPSSPKRQKISVQPSVKRPTFHPNVHGSNVVIENGGSTARSVYIASNSICCSQEPIEIDEKVNLMITKCRRFKGSMRFGFTSRNPDSLKELLSHPYANMAFNDRVWIKPLPDIYGKQGNIVTYSVNKEGLVHFSISGGDNLLLLDNVDVSSSGQLWAVVDLYGSTEAVELQADQACGAIDRNTICEGDLVRLNDDLDSKTLHYLQEEHGGVFPDMEKEQEKVGKVTEIDGNNDAAVYFPEIDQKWVLNPATLQKIEKGVENLEVIQEGDLVKTGTDLAKVRSLQKERGIDDDIEKFLGKVGRVETVAVPSGDISVRIDGKSVMFSRKAVEKIPGKGEMCERGIHRWSRGYSKICKQCEECTSRGNKCIMTRTPHRPVGSTCGCLQRDGGCELCGICRKCAGESSNSEDSELTVVTGLCKEELRKGDEVKVDLDADTFQILQNKGEVGWHKGMLQVVGVPGTVTGLTKKGAQVKFSTGTIWCLVPGCLTKISAESEVMKKGSLVRMINDEDTLRKLQEGHGGYNEDMRINIGKTGIVRKVKKRIIQVDFYGRKWWLNRAALTPVLSGDAGHKNVVLHIKENDNVKVVVDHETFQSDQVGHGGYEDKMQKLLGKIGMVHHFDVDGDAIVCYPDGTKWCLNPMSLGKVSPEDCEPVDVSHVVDVGDWVKVEADKERIKRIQEETVPWDDVFYDVAGKVGHVRVSYLQQNIVRVFIKNGEYPLNPLLVRKATSMEVTEAFDGANVQNPDFARGDLVKISVPLDKLKSLQHGHGGFVDSMSKHTDLIGSVKFIDSSGDVHVRFSPRGYRINSLAVSKVAPTEDTFHVGDLVAIESDKSRVKSLQTLQHGDYVSVMSKTCGAIGRVHAVISKSKIRVKVQGRTLIFNPDLLTRKGNPGLDHVDWKAATICAVKKHDWSKGRCMVCVVCKECTHYGKQCPARDRPGRSPGSICGCGNGHAGCDDCGRCKTCAEEEDDSDMDSDSDGESDVGAKLGKLIEARAEDFFGKLMRLTDPPNGEAHEHDLAKGDEVQVDIDLETFRILQEEGNGGWDDAMIKVIGVPGTVACFDGKNVHVNFQNGACWSIVPGCLTKKAKAEKTSGTSIKKGDLVKVISEEKKLKEMQAGHGGYDNEMQSCLGKTGRVLKIHSGSIQVDILGKRWWFNPNALTISARADGQASHLFQKGDNIKVNVDPLTFKANQSGHGGFKDKMLEMLNKVGVIHHIDIDGDAVVYYPNGLRMCINPMSLGKVSPEDCEPVDVSHVVEVGDWVKVEADKERIKRIQEETVPWDDDYYDAARKVGDVERVNYCADFARVRIKSAVYPLHFDLIKKATAADLEETFDSKSIESPGFARGDLVKIGVSLDQLRTLQQGHGGYVDSMEKVMDLIGSVSFIDSDGDVCVRFDPRRFALNPAVLSKVQPTDDALYNGDIVRIEADKSQFIKCQNHAKHGGYNQRMLSTCGQIGRIISVVDEKKIKVKVRGKTWTFNPDLLTKVGSPVKDTIGWSTATICAPGKHDWSKGRCMVCVVCKECTHYGKQCPARDRPGRSPGSICGCGDGYAGCDDCGRCKKCAEEDQDSDDDSDVEEKLEKLFGLQSLLKHVRVTATEFTERPSNDDTDEERSRKFFTALRQMKQVVDLMRISQEHESIPKVYQSLGKGVHLPYVDYNQGAERKEIGDHLANIDAAPVFMEYVNFLSSETTQEAAVKQAPECLGLIYSILVNLTDSSSEFCCAIGRSGLLELLVQELAKCSTTTPAESESQAEALKLITILYNSARAPDIKGHFHDAGAVNILRPYLCIEDQHMRLNALSCLSFIVEASELHIIKVSPDLADYIIALLNQAISSPDHKAEIDNYNKSAMELVATVSSLLRIDDNKHIFVERGLLDLLVTFVEVGNDKEKECAIACIQALATNDGIKTIIKNNSSLVEGLKAQLNHATWSVRNSVKKTLILLET